MKALGWVKLTQPSLCLEEAMKQGKSDLHVCLNVCHFCFSNEIEATLNRLKKLEKDLTVKEKELREV